MTTKMQSIGNAVRLYINNYWVHSDSKLEVRILAGFVNHLRKAEFKLIGVRDSLSNEFFKFEAYYWGNAITQMIKSQSSYLLVSSPTIEVIELEVKLGFHTGEILTGSVFNVTHPLCATLKKMLSESKDKYAPKNIRFDK